MEYGICCLKIIFTLALLNTNISLIYGKLYMWQKTAKTAYDGKFIYWHSIWQTMAELCQHTGVIEWYILSKNWIRTKLSSILTNLWWNAIVVLVVVLNFMCLSYQADCIKTEKKYDFKVLIFSILHGQSVICWLTLQLIMLKKKY